jgi:hypothetical protein
MEENEAALAEFKKEITDTYAQANAATGRQRDLIRDSAAELVKQYRIFEDQLDVQRRLNSYVDEQEVLQNRVNQATEKRTAEMREQERIADDAATKELIRLGKVVEARKKAESDTVNALEIINEKLKLNIITKEQYDKDTQAIYQREINALLETGYRLDQNGIGVQRLKTLVGLLGTETEKTTEIQVKGFAIEEQNIEDIEAAYKRKYVKLTEREIDWQSLQTRGITSMLQGFTDIGAALVDGELSWKSFAKVALNALAEILSAIGAELAAMAALSLIKGRVARAGIAAAASVAAFVASGAIKASVANLAEGGIVMPQPGGVPVTVAEAGVPEIVGPIDKVTRMLGATGLGGDTTPVHLVVNMDSRPFLDKVFDATRNRTVLISAGAVV